MTRFLRSYEESVETTTEPFFRMPARAREPRMGRPQPTEIPLRLGDRARRGDVPGGRDACRSRNTGGGVASERPWNTPSGASSRCSRMSCETRHNSVLVLSFFSIAMGGGGGGGRLSTSGDLLQESSADRPLWCRRSFLRILRVPSS